MRSTGHLRFAIPLLFAQRKRMFATALLELGPSRDLGDRRIEPYGVSD
jgi:hypothetical protein